MEQKLTRAEQSRINGARSHGPKTPEGKLRSSMNHFVHGRRAQYVTVLKEEDETAFRALRLDLHHALGPRNPLERRLVDELASIEWRRQRLAMMETAILDHECCAQRAVLEAECPDPDPGVIVSTAAHHLVESSKLPAFLAARSAQLTYERDATLRHLRTLRHSSPVPVLSLQAVRPTGLSAECDAPNEPPSNPRDPSPASSEPPSPSIPVEPVTA